MLETVNVSSSPAARLLAELDDVGVVGAGGSGAGAYVDRRCTRGSDTEHASVSTGSNAASRKLSVPQALPKLVIRSMTPTPSAAPPSADPSW